MGWSLIAALLEGDGGCAAAGELGVGGSSRWCAAEQHEEREQDEVASTHLVVPLLRSVDQPTTPKQRRPPSRRKVGVAVLQRRPYTVRAGSQFDLRWFDIVSPGGY